MHGLLGYDNIWPRYNYFKIWNLRAQKTSRYCIYTQFDEAEVP